VRPRVTSARCRTDPPDYYRFATGMDVGTRLACGSQPFCI